MSVGLLLAALVFSGCALMPEAREARFLKLGQTYMAKKDYSRAAIEFQNAIRVKKGNAEPYYQLSLAYMAMGDYHSGVPFLRKALELNPNHLQAKVKLAELMDVAGGEYLREAEVQARGVLAVNPNDTDALNALAIAEWRLGEHQNAERDLARAISSAPQNVRASMNLALAKIYQKDMAGAEQIVKAAVAANPKSAEPLVALGGLYALSGKLEAAEQQYVRAVQIDPTNEPALLALANRYLATNRSELADQLYRQISALPVQKYKSIHARFLFQSGKRAEAVAELEKLCKNDPTDRALRTTLVEAYIAVGKRSEATKVLTAALKDNAKDVDALVQRCRINVLEGATSDAERDIAQVLKFQPDSAPAHYVMAKIHEIRGQELMQRQELSEALRLNKFLLPARLDLVQVLTKAKNTSAALHLLDDKELPDSQKLLLPVLEARSWTLWTMGDMSELRKSLDAALRAGRTPDLLILDGLWKLKSGKTSEARASVEEALKINPGDLRALEALSRSYTTQNQRSMALEKVKEYAARQPKSAPVQDLLGTLLLSSGDRAGARVAFQAAKAADPHSLAADLSLVQADLVDGKLDDAQRRLQAVLSADANNGTVHLWMGSLESMRGDYKAALEQFRAAVATDPYNHLALNNLAYLLAEENQRPTEALKYAQRAKELAPDNPEYSDTLGWILYKQGLYPLAIKEIESATTKRADPRWQYHLAMAYAKVGDRTRARAVLEAALKQNPRLREAEVARQIVGTETSSTGNPR
jgi:tetratricopeptide (TPR) repeat protein